MDRDVEARLTAVDALAHPWIEQKVQKKFNEKLASKAVASLSNFHVRLNFILCLVMCHDFYFCFVYENRTSQN